MVGPSSQLKPGRRLEYRVFPDGLCHRCRPIVSNEGVIGNDLDDAVNVLLKKMEKKKR